MAILVDSTFQAGRTSTRPLEYGTLGHYRAVTFSGAVNTISAAGILASLWWADATRFFVLERLSMQLEVLTAITAAPVFDAQAFVFRGATAASSGSGSSVLSGSGDKQKARKTMSSMILTQAGELRTIGTTTAITAVAGKTNDSAPIGAATWGCLFDTSATGTAVLVSPGAAITPGGWQDLYAVTNPYQHPLVLSQNEGIEVQVITANNTSGTVKYAFLWEWAEVSSF